VLLLETPPTFIVHPMNITIHLSDAMSVKLFCEAKEALSYQRERHSGDITNAKGVNSDILIIENLQPIHGGQYRCIASNNSGITLSNYATLTILGKYDSITISVTKNVHIQHMSFALMHVLFCT